MTPWYVMLSRNAIMTWQVMLRRYMSWQVMLNRCDMTWQVMLIRCDIMAGDVKQV